MPVDQRSPGVKGPPLSCDCHLHVFGDPATYPYSAERRNSPPAVPRAEYMAGYQDFAKRCGIERMVFTQPSTYGRDNTCMLDAIRMAGSNARGIVDIAAAPDRIIWGSDYPYLSHADKVNSIDLFNLVAQWMPDAATRQKILVDNPAKLFGFT